MPFSEHRVKSILTSLVGGLGSLAVAPVFFSLIKIIPIVGQTAGLVSLPLSAGAFTYAVGRIFIQHFASGGTFLDFEPAEVREHFRQRVRVRQADGAGPEVVRDTSPDSAGAPVPLIIIYLLLCLLVGVLGKERRPLRVVGWFFVSLLLTPLVGALALLIAGPTSPPSQQR